MASRLGLGYVFRVGLEPEVGMRSALASEGVVDLRMRVCPTCQDDMKRVEFFEDESSSLPRVVWSCRACGSWTE
jgi:hypothetical protein